MAGHKKDDMPNSYHACWFPKSLKETWEYNTGDPKCILNAGQLFSFGFST